MAIRPIILKGPGKPHRQLPAILQGAFATPFQPLDWPALPKVRTAGSIEVATNLLLSVLAVTTVMREPLYHSLPKQPAPFVYVVPNLLTSTLAPAQAAAVPFVPEDFDRLTPPALLREFAPPNLLTSTLAPASALMPPQPLDLGAIQANALLREFAPPNLLTGTLAPAVGPTPFRLADWPAPAPAQFLPSQYPPAANMQLLALPPPAAPFTPFDWPPLKVLYFRADTPVAASGVTMLTALPPEPPPAASGQPGCELVPVQRAERQLVISKRYVESILGEDADEDDFLTSVTETIREAEKPNAPVLSREIGLLSALDTITRAYNVHFETVGAARAAIEGRLVELEEDDLMAVLMILAMADEP